MSKVLGRDVFVRVGADAIAGQTDCSLNMSTNFATSQTKFDSTPVNEPLYVDWDMQVSGEVGREDAGGVTIGELKTAAKAGSRLSVAFEVGSMAAFSGTAIVSSYNESAPVEGKITYSVTLKGVSALSLDGAAVTVNE